MRSGHPLLLQSLRQVPAVDVVCLGLFMKEPLVDVDRLGYLVTTALDEFLRWDELTEHTRGLVDHKEDERLAEQLLVHEALAVVVVLPCRPLEPLEV